MIAVNVNIETIVKFKAYTHMNQTINRLVVFLLSFILVVIPFASVMRAESDLKTSNTSLEPMDQKSIDDLLGPDPYLFDPGNHMDGFDPTKRKDTYN